ncbi:Phenylalanyl-tRNA synthetase, beta subunit, cytoplasmic [Ophidiomyces ophidiicola]|nr:Phenylalanyl-tRNA synthetase, beta subunit, cytoplasmic [Ophidiomyces ophidiicola]KAI2052075.1 Phenylalanyl-tRNA synthetase, beta subunit, cytoplasmic [Ophidiomyces ophidiicola]KAI2054694.1 Phenylalanyl-tRNA synthetase, beta subunit, cytoplasmic [Ophidiomyces ophidiicola]KAI2077538.1 Phenylalanyl-tRNA synthetase, beta subunit, cytoplasmic [Ophidiomyces ophidiicola]KAI2081633.1 Phenylalanyl-tRNA synthetase, beta subunit, cytoplasmic [Ophidiomyces ophidiicola]
MASDLTPQVLDALASSNDPILSSDAFPSAPPTSVKSALDRLSSRDMVQYETIEREEAILSEEAEGIVANGSHEAKVFEAVRAALDGLKISELPNIVGKDVAKVGSGNAFKKGWIKKDKENLRVATDSIEDTAREQLLTIKQTKTYPDAKILADLRKRKLITMQKVITYRISKGPKYAREFVKEQTDLTVDMLADGSWKTANLKPYNFNAKGAVTPSGAFHPLNKVRHEFRQIFFEMGFEEMPTNRFVETGFWNFDALYVPQQHPARDLQDTFYISDPPRADKPREDPESDPHLSKRPSQTTYSKNSPEAALDYEQYWKDVHAVHETGKYGSIGYRYPWSEDESLRLVLRTHTTSVSAYMLHKLAQNPRPARYFSIDRVFRNEAVDATHLAEFHQIEGVIADFGLSLGGLIGFMEVFFAKMGIHGLRFKPAYNPYTEPSLEIFGYHPTLKKWVEIGNSGMFRPEMLAPMGLPKDMRVYGWGLSLERPTMIKYGVSNIRELLGHKTDLTFIESNPAVRLEKD